MFQVENIFIKLTFIFNLIFFSHRVFCDRLIDDKDRESFVGILSENLGSFFDQTFHNICPNKLSPIFGKLLFLKIKSIMNNNNNNIIY